MKKENDEKSDFKYLIKSLNKENSFKQEHLNGYYSNDVGSGIYHELPEEISTKGWSNYRTIRSDSKEFRDILVKDAGRLELLINKNGSELKKIENELDLISDTIEYMWGNSLGILRQESKSKPRYLIQSIDNPNHYLQAKTLGIYSENIGGAIHDKLPTYFLESDKEVINSNTQKFLDILFGSAVKNPEVREKINPLKRRISDDKNNFNIISKTLGSKLRKI